MARAVALALAVAAVAVVVVTTRSRPGTTLQALDAPASTTSTPTSSSSAPASPTSTSTMAEPTTTTSAPTTAAPPPTTATAPLPRTRTLRTESGSITFDVTIEPAHPRAGEVVEFRIDAVDREGGMFFFGLDTGDRVARPTRPSLACTAPNQDAAPEEVSPRPSSDSMVYRHSYRVAADRNVNLYVGTVACSREAHEAEASAVVTVLPGEARSNGPQVPSAWVLQNPHQDRPPEHVLLSFGGADADGFVGTLTLDWGDGSPPSIINVPSSSCVDPRDAYPSSAADDALEHDYAPGHYVATVTIASSGCDGHHSQSATASTEINLEPAR